MLLPGKVYLYCICLLLFLTVTGCVHKTQTPDPLLHKTDIPITTEHELVLCSGGSQYKKSLWTDAEKSSLLEVLDRLTPTDPPTDTIYGTNLVLIAKLDTQEIRIAFRLNYTSMQVLNKESIVKESWYRCSEADMQIISSLAWNPD